MVTMGQRITAPRARAWQSHGLAWSLWCIVCIARFTIQEAVSRRLILTGLLASAAYLLVFGLGFHFAHDKALENARSVAQQMTVPIALTTLTLLGLYVVYFMASFLAVFLAVGSISGEIDSGTVYAILARPLRRSNLVLGRWLAHGALVVVYLAMMAGLVLLEARWIGGVEVPSAVRAMALMGLGALTVMSLAVCGSTLLSTMANGVAVFALIGLAWLGGMVEWAGGLIQQPAMQNLGIVVSLLVPSDALWRAASYYLQPPALLSASSGAGAGLLPFASSLPPSVPFLAWSVGYVVVCLAGALAAFARRDL